MRLFITLAVLLYTIVATAQQQATTQKVATISFVSPGFGYEQPIANHFTIKGRAALTFNWSYSSSDFFGNKFEIAPSPLAATQLRYYYNMNRRERNNKRTTLNSANYLSLLIKYSYSNRYYHYGSDGNYSYNLPTHAVDGGIVWGLQRNFRNRLSLDCSVGPSLYNPIVNKEFSLIADITFGIWLGAKERK